jgi:hypothetical protein
VPGVFIRLGTRDPATPLAKAEPNHSPRFVLDELAVAFNARPVE